jgi:para-nitrobenzyl esterase
VALMPITSLGHAEAAGEQFADALGVAGEADVLAALRNQSADQIIETAFTNRGASNPYNPIVDGWVLPTAPGAVFARGRQQDVPLMIGSTADEGTQLAPRYFPGIDEKGYRAFMEMRFGDFAEKIINLYPLSSYSDGPNAMSEFMTNFPFGAGAIVMARAMEKVASSSYLYHFTRVPPGPAGAELGAFHGSEIPFVFNTHTEGWPQQPYDDALTETMSAYWMQFAATGNPNRDGLPEWPAYDSVTDQHLELGEEIKVGSGLRKDAADLLGKMLESLMKQDKAGPTDSE